MNRGQILYRVAELMEGRRDQFAAEVAAAEGLPPAAARAAVDRAIDRWVWYAGWADKIAQMLGSANPVAAPYFNFTIPEPTGVVGVVAPEPSSLLGLVSRLAPPLVGRQRGRADRRERGRCPRSRWPRSSPPPTSRAASSTSSPGTARSSCPVLAAHVRRRRARRVGRPGRPAGRGRGRSPPTTSSASLRRPTQVDRRALRLARRRRGRAPRVDRRLPRDEDRLAPDRRLTMAVGHRRWNGESRRAAPPSGRSRRRSSGASSSTPRRGPSGRRSTTRPLTTSLFPELRLGPAAPPWPAAATTRSARARLGLLRDAPGSRASRRGPNRASACG